MGKAILKKQNKNFVYSQIGDNLYVDTATGQTYRFDAPTNSYIEITNTQSNNSSNSETAKNDKTSAFDWSNLFSGDFWSGLLGGIGSIVGYSKGTQAPTIVYAGQNGQQGSGQNYSGLLMWGGLILFVVVLMFFVIKSN